MSNIDNQPFCHLWFEIFLKVDLELELIVVPLVNIFTHCKISHLPGYKPIHLLKEILFHIYPLNLFLSRTDCEVTGKIVRKSSCLLLCRLKLEFCQPKLLVQLPDMLKYWLFFNR